MTADILKTDRLVLTIPPFSYPRGWLQPTALKQQLACRHVLEHCCPCDVSEGGVWGLTPYFRDVQFQTTALQALPVRGELLTL